MKYLSEVILKILRKEFITKIFCSCEIIN